MRKNDLQIVSSHMAFRQENSFFDNLIDREELAQKLNVSPSFVSKMMNAEGLPYYKLGRSVRFDACSVKSWLLQRKMP